MDYEVWGLRVAWSGYEGLRCLVEGRQRHESKGGSCVVPGNL